ncbi:MAG: hypothetical protein IIA44_10620, partial [Acidobacteria bacterium]|nr:hypothetical protein [Acidobacteriota bacterium]
MTTTTDHHHPITTSEVGGIGHSIKRHEDDRLIQGAGNFVDVTPLLQMVGLQAKDVDMTGSALVALSMPEMGRPAWSFIVPATDAKNAAEITSLPSTVSGKYLELSMGANPVVGESTPPIAGNLPAADYAIRVNLKALLSKVRQMIEPYLDPEALATLNPRIRDNAAGFATLGA